VLRLFWAPQNKMQCGGRLLGLGEWLEAVATPRALRTLDPPPTTALRLTRPLTAFFETRLRCDRTRVSDSSGSGSGTFACKTPVRSGARRSRVVNCCLY